MVLRGGFYKICLKKQDWIMANPILRSLLYKSGYRNFFAPNHLHRNSFCRQANTKIDKPNM